MRAKACSRADAHVELGHLEKPDEQAERRQCEYQCHRGAHPRPLDENIGWELIDPLALEFQCGRGHRYYVKMQAILVLTYQNIYCILS